VTYNDTIDREALLQLPLLDLVQRANRIRAEHSGRRLDLCTILNAKSGLCSENCKFCAQSSRHATAITTYPLKSREEIIAAAETAKAIGSGRFGIVCSGNRLNAAELAIITEAVREIKERVGISICGSLGALSRKQLSELQQAGLSRYHHNIETSRRFYPRIVTTHSFDERIQTIRDAHAVGLEVCSGGIIGMGEDWDDRIDMALTLRDLPVDSVPVNILVPIKGTPLESQPQLSCGDAIRTICIFRIILQDKTVKIAAGRETMLKDFQAMGFMAGANGMIIGGYLTIKGREVEADQQLIREIQALWET
jgi:biotin synthase